MSDSETPGIGRSLSAVVGGVALSFLAFGLLWIGTPWPAQALMAVPFFFLAWALIRSQPGAANQLLTFILCGAAPLGLLMTKFRDKNDSHVYPILVVGAWGAGAVAGRLASRPKS